MRGVVESMLTVQKGYALLLCLVFSAMLSITTLHVVKQVLVAENSANKAWETLKLTVNTQNMKQFIIRQPVYIDEAMQQVCFAQQCFESSNIGVGCQDSRLIHDTLQPVLTGNINDWGGVAFTKTYDDVTHVLSGLWYPFLMCTYTENGARYGVFNLHLLGVLDNTLVSKYDSIYWESKLLN